MTRPLARRWVRDPIFRRRPFGLDGGADSGEGYTTDAVHVDPRPEAVSKRDGRITDWLPSRYIGLTPSRDLAANPSAR